MVTADGLLIDPHSEPDQSFKCQYDGDMDTKWQINITNPEYSKWGNNCPI